MSIIKSEDIQPGMVLVKDVTNHCGAVLLHTGKKITEKNIRIFKMWGIAEIDVHDIKRKEVTTEEYKSD